MPASDCVFLYNFIPYQYGLRVRSGWKEWCTNVGVEEAETTLYGGYGSPLAMFLSSPLGGQIIGGYTDLNPDGVRTIIPFYGRVPENNRLFACSPEGIYDCTLSSAAPTQVYTFPIGRYITPSGNEIVPSGAGYGNFTSFANSDGDHFIAYCDGANGYLLYTETTGQWTKVTRGTGAGQIPATSSTGGPIPDPDSFRYVTSWKNRLWFVPEGSSTAYYLPTSQFAGTANPVYFGSRFRFGGELVGLWSWTVDGGLGIDDLLVGISRGGDVVVYKGTDPTYAETFGLHGVWWAGQVPPGRNIASDFGGDLFILSRLGCVPLSKLVSGGLIRDPKLFATQKVSNLFNTLMTERGHIIGWSIKMHPTDNLLVVNVPPSPSKPGLQLVMSLATYGWAIHRGVPMACMEAWQGSLYFGTADGRVCKNEGYVDGSALDGSGSYAIDASLLTAYNAMGSSKKKRIHLIRPHFSTDGTAPSYSVNARYDFDLTEIGTVPTPVAPASNAWGTARWGTARWGSDTGTTSKIGGSTGVGSAVAITLRVTSKAACTLVGFDTVYDQGGYL
jgi:hypothetical protein